MICGAYSEVCTSGLHVNQDHMGYIRLQGAGGAEITAAVVADGVSMGYEGKYASYNAVLTLLEWARDYFSENAFDLNETASQIQWIMQDLNNRLNAFSEQHSDNDTCTTLCGCVTDGETMLLFHAGDSRAYAFSDSGAECFTKDDKGENGHSISMHIGGMEPDQLNVHFSSLSGAAEKVFLFCTDGLYETLSLNDWTAEIRAAASREELCAVLQDMARAARAAGETDDITGVLVNAGK